MKQESNQGTSRWNLLNRLNPFFKNKTSTSNNTTSNKTDGDKSKDLVKLPSDEELKDDVVFLKAFEGTMLVRAVHVI